MKPIFFFTSIIISLHTIAQDLNLETFALGFSTPTTITNAGDNRLFVCEKSGQIKIINPNGTVESTPFLDISTKVSNGSEQGLLGLAFHPNYNANGQFYVHYTNSTGNNIISQFSRNTLNTADINSELILLNVSQPFSNHNGGHITFGPDNKLYISIGDGGSGNDPQRNAQNTTNLLGTILRLDVDIPAPYIPASNPFAGITGQDAIWAYGLRNPYKFSFDSNDLWIADVGDNVRGGDEEVNRALGNPAALNYGWRCFEGYDARNNDVECNGAVLTPPVDTYDRNRTPRRCSITGGYVYRGAQHPSLFGKYIFGDFCSREILLINPINIDNNSNTTAIEPFGPFNINITTFGVNNNQELFVGGRNPSGGSSTIYRIIDNNTVLNIADFKNSTDEYIFPNPAKDSFKIKIDSPITEVKLYDAKGRWIKQFTTSEIKNETFNINTLNSGLYFLTIKTSNTSLLKQKLLKK